MHVHVPTNTNKSIQAHINTYMLIFKLWVVKHWNVFSGGVVDVQVVDVQGQSTSFGATG